MRYGEGSISDKPRKDGRFMGRFRFRDPSTGEVKMRAVYGATRNEVVIKLRAALTARDGGTLSAASGKLTFGAYITDWLAANERRWRGRTFDSYSSNIRCHIMPNLGAVPLTRLTTPHIRKFHGVMFAGGASNKTVRNVHAVLSSALDQAVEDRLIPFNPAASVKLPPVVQREMTALTLEQAAAVLRAAEADPRWPLWRLAIVSGLREGEIGGLTWRDIDLEAGTVTVRAGLEQRPGRKPQRAAPKTKHSRRVVDIDPPTVAALRPQRTTAIESALAHGKSFDEDGWVFLADRKGPMRSNAFWRAWRRLQARAGIKRPVRFHDLRHTAATLLLARGLDVRSVADVLGHADVATTLRTYVHGRPDAARQAIHSLGEALG